MLKITKSAKNLSVSVDVDEDAEVGVDNGDDETVKRSPLFKKPNVPTGYLTFLRSDADSVPFRKI